MRKGTAWLRERKPLIGWRGGIKAVIGRFVPLTLQSIQNEKRIRIDEFRLWTRKFLTYGEADCSDGCSDGAEG